MKNPLMKSKFMYYYIIIFTILTIIGNFVLLVIATSLTKPIYTQTVDYGSGLIGTLTYSSPIYPVLKTNQVVLLALVNIIIIVLFAYFLYCFVNNRVKVSKILGITLYGLIALSSLSRLKIIMAALSLLVVGYLLNIKTSAIIIKENKLIK